MRESAPIWRSANSRPPPCSARRTATTVCVGAMLYRGDHSIALRTAKISASSAGETRNVYRPQHFNDYSGTQCRLVYLSLPSTAPRRLTRSHRRRSLRGGSILTNHRRTTTTRGGARLRLKRVDCPQWRLHDASPSFFVAHYRRDLSGDNRSLCFSRGQCGTDLGENRPAHAGIRRCQADFGGRDARRAQGENRALGSRGGGGHRQSPADDEGLRLRNRLHDEADHGHCRADPARRRQPVGR